MDANRVNTTRLKNVKLWEQGERKNKIRVQYLFQISFFWIFFFQVPILFQILRQSEIQNLKLHDS